MADLLLNIVSGVSLIAVIGYLLHSAYTGYRDFKKDAYRKFEELDEKKMSKRECNEYRIYERRAFDQHRTESYDGPDRRK